MENRKRSLNNWKTDLKTEKKKTEETGCFKTKNQSKKTRKQKKVFLKLL